MAQKKQSKKQSKKKSKKKSSSKTSLRGRKVSAAKKSSKLKSRSRKRAAKPAPRARKRKPAVNTEAEIKREFRGRSRTSLGRQEEDFDGLSRAEGADSESVDELVDEGNAFEAGVVAGVEEADDSDEREVHTREVPEDDVPQEYLDED